MNNYQGKIFIIGINFLNEKGIILEHYQTSSIVIEVKESIIKLRRKNQRYRILTLFLILQFLRDSFAFFKFE